MVAYSFRPQFVAPILVGLGHAPHAIGAEFWSPRQSYYPKRQTIRAVGRRRHARPGDELQLYTGMRTKSCRLIGRARCVAVVRATIWVADWCVMIEGRGVLGPRQLGTFAREDGFADAAEMAAFWRKEHGPVEKWNGVLITWEPIAESAR